MLMDDYKLHENIIKRVQLELKKIGRSSIIHELREECECCGQSPILFWYQVLESLTQK